MGSMKHTVLPEDSRTRLDVYLARKNPALTRSRIKKLIDEGHVLVDGMRMKAGAMLTEGNIVRMDLPDLEPSGLKPEDIPLNILYEDSDLLVLDKPPHMVVHPAHGHAGGTLVNALLHHCRDLSGIGGVARPGIVHRLDKGTSGVMVVAKNDPSHLDLSNQFREHTIRRVYIAGVRGKISHDYGVIDKPLGRHRKDRKRMAPRENGREAQTDFSVTARRGGMSLVELRPGTGRTHQLRVHLSSIGHPVLGDSTYGGGTRSINTGDQELRSILRSLKRPALHALNLGFIHPSSGQEMSFEAAPPADLERLFAWIRGSDR
ncbi:RluA family pseudouridine synthase [bacterium]|nr:MAG: RluA family pseudouridine synthase [bacterium]